MTSYRHITGTAFLGLAFLSGLASFGLFVNYWDPSRTVIKRLAETDSYTFEEINPELAARNIAGEITIRSAADISQRREKLIEIIWGEEGLPRRRRPEKVETDVASATTTPRCDLPGDHKRLMRPLSCALDLYEGLDNLERIDRLSLDVIPDHVTQFAHFVPTQSNGKLVIYQHGFAGTYHEQHRHLARLLKTGYGIMAHNLNGYGENLPRLDIRETHAPLGVKHPLRILYEPIVVSINHGIRDGRYKQVDMIGFSMGGYMAAVSAALDPRIRRTIAVASPFPLIIRTTDPGPAISRYKPMVERVSLMDSYVMASAGESRSLTLIQNRFDKCCWGNLTAALVEPAIKETLAVLGGRFRVAIDESHPRHKISRLAFEAILEELERP